MTVPGEPCAALLFICAASADLGATGAQLVRCGYPGQLFEIGEGRLLMATERPRIAALLADAPVGAAVDVSGWVRTRRDSKNGFSFVELNDGSCMSNLQVVVDASVPGYEETIREVHTGASVRVTGELKESPVPSSASSCMRPRSN